MLNKGQSNRIVSSWTSYSNIILKKGSGQAAIQMQTGRLPNPVQAACIWRRQWVVAACLLCMPGGSSYLIMLGGCHGSECRLILVLMSKGKVHLMLVEKRLAGLGSFALAHSFCNLCKNMTAFQWKSEKFQGTVTGKSRP